MTTFETDDNIARVLLTTSEQGRLVAWAKTASIANWIEGRRNYHGSKTWIITVGASDFERFMELVKGIDNAVTVERIHGAGDSETYEMLVGTPGEGWARA